MFNTWLSPISKHLFLLFFILSFFPDMLLMYWSILPLHIFFCLLLSFFFVNFFPLLFQFVFLFFLFFIIFFYQNLLSSFFFFKLLGVIKKHLDWITLGFFGVSWRSGNVVLLRIVLSIPECFIYHWADKFMYVYNYLQLNIGGSCGWNRGIVINFNS